jgi:metal-responsive CopG/Arc/MetJ family transcriptional regulator
MKKVTISLPDEQAEAIEQIRRKRGVSRSRVVQQAIALTLVEEEMARAIHRYEEGYRRQPERAEAIAFAKVAARVLAKERWSI